MADSKTSALPAVASVADAQEFPVNDAGTSKKATAAQVKTYIGALVQGPGTAVADDKAVRGDTTGIQGSTITIGDSGELSGDLKLRKALSNVVTDRDEGSGSDTADSGAYFENAQATTEPTTVTLDSSPVLGQHHIFCNLSVQGMTVIASGTQVIRAGALASSAGGSFNSTVVGARLDLIYAFTNVWVGILSGTWTAA